MPPCMQRFVFWFSSRLRVGKLFGLPPNIFMLFLPPHPKRSAASLLFLSSTSLRPSPFLHRHKRLRQSALTDRFPSDRFLSWERREKSPNSSIRIRKITLKKPPLPPISRLYSICFRAQPLWDVTRGWKGHFSRCILFYPHLVISFACNLNFPPPPWK